MTRKNGGRIELKLDPTSTGSAEYEARLQTATASLHGTVRVGASAARKQVDCDTWTTEAVDELPEGLKADARAVLQAALRSRRSEGRRPRRICWRPELVD